MGEHPPRPRLALAVGVIGHQPDRLPSEPDKLALIAGEIATTLDAVCREAAAAHGKYSKQAKYFSDNRPVIAVISALAEGADRMVASAAIACSQPAPAAGDIGVDVVLDVALPFPGATYKDDFSTEQSKAEFDGLLKQARSVLVLPGESSRAADTGYEAASRENRAYESVGLTLINQSDIIIAVWDGEASAGRGGTQEMLNFAARSGTPIIHIDAKAEQPTRIRWDGISNFPARSNAVNDLPSASLNTGLPRLIDELLRPPEEKSAEHQGRPNKPADKRTTDPERERLKAYYEKLLWPVNYGLAFPLLMAVFGVRPLRQGDWRPPPPEKLAKDLLAFDQSEPPNAKLQEQSVLATAFGWADACGVWLAQVFRSAFVMNFSLAAFAVVVAAVSLVASDITQIDKTVMAAALMHHKVPYVIVEVVFILAVIVITIAGYWGGWHHRWLEAREVAERLRVAFPLWTLGLRPTTFPAEEPAWTGWYARAIVREQGMRSAFLGAAGLQQARATLKAVLSDQCNYHRTTARRMQSMETRLELLGMILFGLTLAALAAFLGAWLDHVTAPTRLTYLVTGAAAGFPALGTATFGIRVIGDFDGIARRSQRTHEVLQQIIDAMDAENPPSLATLQARARAASDVMLGDVSSWRLAAESRTLAIPS